MNEMQVFTGYNGPTIFVDETNAVLYFLMHD